jgi:hypothetical protein
MQMKLIHWATGKESFEKEVRRPAVDGVAIK